MIAPFQNIYIYYKQTLFSDWQCMKYKSLHSTRPKKIHTSPQETCRCVSIVQRRQPKKTLHSMNHVSEWLFSGICSQPTPSGTPENKRCNFCCPQVDIMGTLALSGLDKFLSKCANVYAYLSP